MNNMNNIGILDPFGNYPNPLNNKPYSDKYKELAKIWSSLPAYKKANEIINSIKNNQVILTIFETSAGKTVLNPKFALHAFNYNAKIGITLPKRIIAKSAAEFAALTLDVEIGDQVGYQFKGSPTNSKSDKTKLLYATDGTIVARIMKDPTLKEFDAIIIDEAHERKIQTDFLLYLLRETLRIRPEFKIIIMSATINSDLFANYFRDFKFDLIKIPGARTFPIESIFLDNQIKQYTDTLEKGFEILKHIINNTKSGDIIFFVTSSSDAFNLCQKINEFSKTIFCIEVYAGMNPEKQVLAQNKDKYKENTEYSVYKRKVVVATNVAESSLTIDGIKYVIDSGYELKGGYDPILRGRILERKLITQAQAKQRMGRAGRTEPGVCYHLYTEDEFRKMAKFPEPEIETNDITGECLKLLCQDKVNNIENMIKILTNFIEPPKEDFIRAAISTLTYLTAIKDGILTDYGRILNDIPEDDIFLANTLLYGKIYNCSKEITKINIMINLCKGNISELFNHPNKNNKELTDKFKKAKNKLSHKSGDHLTLLNIFEKVEEFIKNNNKDKFWDFCYKHFLKGNLLIKIVDEYKKSRQRQKQIFINKDKIKYIEKINTFDIQNRVLAAITFGSSMNTAILKDSHYHTKFYKKNKDKDKIKINKMSSLTKLLKLPKNIVFYELFISMNQMSLSIVSKIPNKIIKVFKV